jgi:DNA-binding NarL/FixJ family response regulator
MPERSDIQLLIVEDDETVRESLAYLLLASGFGVRGKFESAEALLSFLEENTVDDVIVLLDLELPGLSGVELLRSLRKREQTMEVVVLTVFDDRESLMAALKAGASGYILKDTPHDSLCRAVEEVANGGAPMSPAVARRILREFHTEDEEQPLSPREREVLAMLVKGYTYEQIGEGLFISSGTVQVHLRNIYRKLGVKSRTAAVAKALRNRLVD